MHRIRGTLGETMHFRRRSAGRLSSGGAPFRSRDAAGGRVARAGGGARRARRHAHRGASRPGGARREAPRRGLPLHVLLLQARDPAAVAPRCRGRAGGCSGPARVAVVRARRRTRERPRRRRCAALREGGPPPQHPRDPSGHGGAPRLVRVLRPARVGDGVPDGGGAPPGAAPAGCRGHGCGGGGPRSAVHALRCVPLLHPRRRPPQPRPAQPRRPGRVRAAGVPARGHGRVPLGREDGAARAR